VSLVYLDACAIIYLVEGAQAIQQTVKTRLSQHHANALTTSRLSRLECRIGPLKNNAASLLSIYEAFLSAAGLTIVELTADVIERATDLRAAYGFKTPDALHLGSAIEGGADIFITGDGKLARCREYLWT
jgi:predicted nucleic acid-binding protein